MNPQIKGQLQMAVHTLAFNSHGAGAVAKDMIVVKLYSRQTVVFFKEPNNMGSAPAGRIKALGLFNRINALNPFF